MLLSLAQYLLNCPLTEQSAFASPRASFVNGTHVRVNFPFMSKFIQVSEYSSFNVTNIKTENIVQIPIDPAGNCFVNANNAFSNANFSVQVESCNFVQFIFRVQSQPKLLTNGTMQKKIYYRVDGKDGQIIMNMDDRYVNLDLDDNLYFEVYDDDNYMIKSEMLVSATCDDQSVDVERGVSIIPKECEFLTFSYFDGGYGVIKLTENYKEYSSYRYKEGDTRVATVHGGRLCEAVGQGYFQRAYDEWLSQQPDEPIPEPTPDPDPEEGDGEDNEVVCPPQLICAEPNIVVDGQCVDSEVRIRFAIGALAVLAGIIM